MEQLQIVEAFYNQQNKPLNTSILIAIYNAADELTGISGNDEDATKERVKKKLGQIEARLGDNITVSYICVSGRDDAVNPCRPSRITNWTSMRSVMFLDEGNPSCSRHCILKPSQPTDTYYIAWNVLVNQTQSPSFQVAYSTSGGNDWQCLNTKFHKLSTSDEPLHLLLSWKSKLNLTRLWFSFDGVPFDISCGKANDRTIPCSRTSTTSVATSTTPTSNRTLQTPQSDDLTQIIIAAVSVAGVIIIAIIVAVAVYQVKKQSQDAAHQMNPGTNQSAAITNAQFEPSAPTAGGAFMIHNYSELQVPPPPETGTADPEEDAQKTNRKRTAYCHYAADYEDWVIPNNCK